jgi:hypothetical protein
MGTGMRCNWLLDCEKAVWVLRIENGSSTSFRIVVAGQVLFPGRNKVKNPVSSSFPDLALQLLFF